MQRETKQQGMTCVTVNPINSPRDWAVWVTLASSGGNTGTKTRRGITARYDSYPSSDGSLVASHVMLALENVIKLTLLLSTGLHDEAQFPYPIATLLLSNEVRIACADFSKLCGGSLLFRLISPLTSAIPISDSF